MQILPEAVVGCCGDIVSFGVVAIEKIAYVKKMLQWLL